MLAKSEWQVILKRKTKMFAYFPIIANVILRY